MENNLSGFNSKLPEQEITKGKISSAGTFNKSDISGAGTWNESDLPNGISKGKISGNGRFGKNDVPGDTVYGNAQGKLGYNDLEGNFPGIKEIPKNVARDADLAALRRWAKKNFRAK